MFATCLHCHKPLGQNDAIEALPIGRRVAFDAKRGRLWVVCRRCERWNLTPFDARWEAIEQGERAFRDTRVRVSTDNIGLARLKDGTELVRIGNPLRPEFAAWRYGDQFGRRRVRNAAMAVGITGGLGLLAGGAIASGAGLLALMPIFHVLNLGGLLISQNLRAWRPMPHPDGGMFVSYGMPRLIESPSSAGWGVELGFSEHYEVINGRSVPREYGQSWNRKSNEEIGRVQLHGAEALPLLRQVLPRVNKAGATRTLIADGVQMIDQAGGSEQFGRWAATQRRAWASKQVLGDSGDFQYIPAPARLAFEMSMHEDAERRAMEGELALLERAWADAEQIAGIADQLLIPPAVEQKLEQLRGDVSPKQD